jgi:rare lipoprotein A
MRWISLLLLLGACAGVAERPAPMAVPSGAAGPATGVKVGRPYEVFGRTYVPADDRAYEEVGIASWYGPGFQALATANGETYDQEALTAAHKTLPMPSWVEVENLDNGRKLVVRVNDRGPFVDGRIIDLSRRAAVELGVDRPGLARVRVRRVFPDGDWARDVPPILVAAPAPRPAAGDLTGGYFVQVAALSDAGRAEYLAADFTDVAPGRTEPSGTGLWRVRLGPFPDAASAGRALDAARARGFADARILRP